MDLKENEKQKREKYLNLLVKLHFESLVKFNANENTKHIGTLKRCNSYKLTYQRLRKYLESFVTEEIINTAFEAWRV